MVAKKIRKSEAAPKIVENNGIIALVEFVLLPAAALAGTKEFRVERRDAEPLIYTDIQQLKDDYANDIVCGQNSLNVSVSGALANNYTVDTPVTQACSG